MPRTTARPLPTAFLDLEPRTRACPACGHALAADYPNTRCVTTRDGVRCLDLLIRRCHRRGCDRYLVPFRPEAEGRPALPHHAFGLDVMAHVGVLRYARHRSVPEIRRGLTARGVVPAPRRVTNLPGRYDELLALAATGPQRLSQALRAQGRVILAPDGWQPDVGHEVLWVVRDCPSSRVPLAQSLLSATRDDLAGLIRRAQEAVGVPIVAAVSDGQHPIRKAVAEALPGVPHPLCRFHYLREAARPVYEADRHAKKGLEKRVRGVRVPGRQVGQRDDPTAEVVRGYGAAVRGALTDDGRPPPAASGLLLEERLRAIGDSPDRAGEKGGSPPS